MSLTKEHEEHETELGMGEVESEGEKEKQRGKMVGGSTKCWSCRPASFSSPPPPKKKKNAFENFLWKRLFVKARKKNSLISLLKY